MPRTACCENARMPTAESATRAEATDMAPTELPWQHGFAALGSRFFAPVLPTPLPQPYWVAHSVSAGDRLGLPSNWFEQDRYLQALSGNAPVGAPLSSVYSGHQFGVWAGQLGDGRALLLGELNGLEVQLKGAGPTPFSRRGDGRAVLRSSIREFLCCEAMRGLRIPTTDALCLTGSNAPIWRETVETAAVVTRIAPSFIRFGHFEHFSYGGQTAQLQALMDYVVDRYYPSCRHSADEQWDGKVAAALLAEVATRSAALVAQWQAVGFCHGVLNTDNMSILGITLDYGPFQFLDAFDPGHICNHTDQQGRYAFDRQPEVVHWNVHGLAQALLPLIGSETLALRAMESFAAHFNSAYLELMARKLGYPEGTVLAPDLLATLLGLLAEQGVDYTIFWRRLSQWVARRDPADASVRDLFVQPSGLEQWLDSYLANTAETDWLARSARMLACNPLYVLRNHMAETAIREAQQGNFSRIALLQRVLASPFEAQADAESLADFPPAWAQQLSVSCSS